MNRIDKWLLFFIVIVLNSLKNFIFRVIHSIEIRDGISQKDAGINKIKRVDLIQFILKINVEGSNDENKLVIIFNYS